jgi:uncharacterized protein
MNENYGNCAKSGFILTEIGQAFIIPRLMQAPPLPDRINPWQLAAENGRLNGELNLAGLPRLAAMPNHAGGTVSVTLVAGTDGQGVRFIKGRLRTGVELVCQRCLGPLRLPLEVVISLGLVRGEAEFDRLPDEYEPLLVPEGGIAVADLVEDELLLALPRIPRHEDARDCEAHGYRTSDRVEQDQPFATLASLLRDSQRSH